MAEPTTTSPRTLLRIGVKLTAFLALNTVLGFAVLMLADRTHRYEPWETDSLFESNPTNEDYDLILMGTSRTYALSRFRDNHQYLEEATGMNVLNLGLPVAGGVKPARCYLEYYLDAGVHPDQLVYLLDPFVFYGVGPNEYHKFVYFERFSPRFLIKLAQRGLDWRRLLIYVRSKFTAEWFFREAEPLIRHERTVPAPVSEEQIAHRVKSLFLDDMEEKNFARYAAELEAILARCQAEGIPVTLAYPPTLLGTDPAQPRLDEWLNERATRYDFQRYDWTDAMADPDLFYDLDHMNVWGVERFVDAFLKPAVQRTKPGTASREYALERYEAVLGETIAHAGDSDSRAAVAGSGSPRAMYSGNSITAAEHRYKGTAPSRQ